MNPRPPSPIELALQRSPATKEHKLRKLQHLCDEAFKHVEGTDLECNILFFDRTNPVETTGMQFLCTPIGANYTINLLMDRMGLPEYMVAKAREIISDGLNIYAYEQMKKMMGEQNLEFSKENQDILDELYAKHPKPEVKEVQVIDINKESE